MSIIVTVINIVQTAREKNIKKATAHARYNEKARQEPHNIYCMPGKFAVCSIKQAHYHKHIRKKNGKY